MAWAGDERDDVAMYNRIGSGIFTWALHGMYFETYIPIDEIKFSLRGGFLRDEASMGMSKSRPPRMLYGTAVVPALIPAFVGLYLWWEIISLNTLSFLVCNPKTVFCVGEWEWLIDRW